MTVKILPGPLSTPSTPDLTSKLRCRVTLCIRRKMPRFQGFVEFSTLLRWTRKRFEPGSTISGCLQSCDDVEEAQVLTFQDAEWIFVKAF